MELNAILQANADILSEMFKLLGNTEKQKHYSEIGQRFLVGIEVVSDVYSRGINGVCRRL